MSKTLDKPISIMSWGNITKDTRSFRPIYQINLACSSQVIVNHLVYDVGAVRYVLRSEACTMPTAGLVRNYWCAATDDAGECLLAGTSNGEFCVFNVQHKIYRTSVPISSNGVTSLVSRGEKLFVGSGDGMVKLLNGRDCEWMVERQVKLAGRVVSLSLDKDASLLLAGTDAGRCT